MFDHLRPRLIAVAGLAFVLAACGGKSETEQLAELRDGLAYTQYRRVSESGLPGALEAYRLGAQWSGKAGLAAPELPPIGPADLCIAHVLLAYAALGADKTTLAIAETDIVEAQDCAPFDDLAAASLRSVAFHRQEWPQLAQAESERVWAVPRAPGAEQTPAGQMLTLHLGLGYLAVSEKRWDRAQIHADALGQMLQAPWLGKIAAVGVAVQEGRVGEALVELKRLSQDPSVPAGVRKELTALIAQAEAKGGDVDSFAFMPRLIATLAWDAAKQHGPTAVRAAANLADEQKLRPMGESLQKGVGQAGEAAGSLWNKAREALTPSPDAPADKTAPAAPAG
ncbi:hypothetical protein K4L06_16100 [Lysobacter sp. BMK333-48F3]|uniref:hypothetical protein n=1 Tax=Lysobacter sp. BMK333-48F3 TaxID=2867962 RepID=UPI001C8CC76F|nr:hypothetical protein [Lysobacter sp. BMK333-48F3]MBX9402833.1 hypothetical protein [Lysobacter sp. BMK333-48F3]